MTRDPDALHVGQTVQTPNGIGIIRARRCGPITTWLALDFWWRESQLTPAPEMQPTGISPACRRERHHICGGGYMNAGVSTVCVCSCAHIEGSTRHGIEAD